MSKGLTLLHYWEKLTAKQLRLIHDLLKAYSRKRQGINMGLLPFIPVKEIKLMLLRDPMSPWTEHLFTTEYSEQDPWIRDDINSRYQRSKETDRKEYAEILQIITQQPERKTQIGALLELWMEHHHIEEIKDDD